MSASPVTDPTGPFARLWRRFCDLELELGLFEQRVDGAWIWDWLRVPVHHALVEAVGLRGPSADGRHRRPGAYLRAAAGIARSVLLRRPPQRPVDVAILGHPRRKLGADGTWWDIYCDPLIEHVLEPAGLSSLLFERPHDNRHLEPARTRSIAHLDALALAAAIARKVARRPRPTAAEMAFLSDLEARVRREFEVTVPVRAIALQQLALRASQLPRYRKLLRALDPRLLMLVVSYGNETILEAARSLRIPTAELQHGTIDAMHPGYSFPAAAAKKRNFPDYYLAFGSHWHDVTPLPLARDRIFDVGFPYLDGERARWHDVGRRGRILFLSQQTIGAELSRWAVATARCADIDDEIVYKLHPMESAGWKERYPWLADERVRVVADDTVSLHELMATSTVQVGVYSTALYEGLAFGLQTFVAGLPAAELVAGLVESCASVARVSSPQELIEGILCRRPVTTGEVERFFAPDSEERLRRAIGEILRRECMPVT